MGNMSYCRFRNTLEDLRDCKDFVENFDLSEEENKARMRLIEECKEIAGWFEDYELYDDLKDHFSSNNQFKDEKDEDDE